MSLFVAIMVVEDHPVFRKGLIDILNMEPDWKVVEEASNGAEALRKLGQCHPDVMVCDIDMPELNGLELARQLQSQNHPVKIILLTMYREEDIFNEAMDVGVKGFVLKESALSEVTESIKAVIAGRSYVSPALSDMLLNRQTVQRQFQRDHPGLARLTEAERRIIKRISLDQTSKEIAEELCVSIRTVENHRANISTKLGLHGSHSLLKFAFDNKAKL